jgi:hypothetical protein
MQTTRPKAASALAALAQALFLLAGGLSLGATPVAAGSCGDWEKGWGDETESCVFSCSAHRQLTASIGSDHSYAVSASAACGNAGATCSLPTNECVGHGGVTTQDDAAGQCFGEGKADWWKWNTIQIGCDDSHAVPGGGIGGGPNIDAAVKLLHTLLSKQDDWSCTAPKGNHLQGSTQLMQLVPQGTTVVLMKSSFYSDSSGDAQTAQGLRLTSKSCRNFQPHAELVHVDGEDASVAKLSTPLETAT